MIDEKKLIEEFNIKSIKYDDMCGDAIEENDCGMQMIYAGKGLAYVEAIKIVEKQPKVGEWIPVSERLPEDRKEKIVYLSSNRITIACYNEHVLPHTGFQIGWGYILKNGYIDFEKENVIAWMPLPELYRPEKE
ncbi:MAG: DUF551 domain-containing protein [Bariatricus sp.]